MVTASFSSTSRCSPQAEIEGKHRKICQSTLIAAHLRVTLAAEVPHV
jgi:hypothetical protein